MSSQNHTGRVALLQRVQDNEGSDSKSIIRKYFRSTLFRDCSKSFRQFESYVEYKIQGMCFKVMNTAKGQNVLF